MWTASMKDGFAVAAATRPGRWLRPWRSVPAATMLRLLALAPMLGMAVVASGCGDARDAEPVDVFAAASLTDAFSDIAASFEADNPGVEIRLTFGGSTSLREQILDGAAVDVFASASGVVMDTLVDEGRVAAEPIDFAANRLVLAVPAGNPAGVTTLDDLARPGLFVGLCAAGVPCGDLADRVLAHAEVDPSVDTREPDVRALTHRLIDGELDAGLVYATDAVAFAEDLEVIEGAVPAGADRDADGAVTIESVAHYPIVVLDQDSGAAAGFVDYVVDGPGAAILDKWGFAPHCAAASSGCGPGVPT